MKEVDCKTQKMIKLLIERKTLSELEKIKKEYGKTVSVLRLLGTPADDETQQKQDKLFFVERCVRLAVEYLKSMPQA